MKLKTYFTVATQTFEGTNLTITGWGYTTNNGQLSPNLKFGFVNGWNNTACRATGYGNIITANMICASSPKIDIDTCQGDSGGYRFKFQMYLHTDNTIVCIFN